MKKLMSEGGGGHTVLLYAIDIKTMKTVTILRSDIFGTHVLHVYTYSGVFTNIFELNLISIVMKTSEEIIAVLSFDKIVN